MMAAGHIVIFLCLQCFVNINAVTTQNYPIEGACLESNTCNTAVCCQGMKGEIGRGIQGFPGPQGSQGEIGRPGAPGPASDGADSVQSAFTAVKTSSQRSVEGEDILTFDRFVTDSGDGQFDTSSGIFRCSIPGIYMFTFSVYAYSSHTTVSLVKGFLTDSGLESYVIVAAHHFHGKGEDVNTQIGNSATVRLTYGGMVWLKVDVGNVIIGDSKQITSLTGVRLFGISNQKGSPP